MKITEEQSNIILKRVAKNKARWQKHFKEKQIGINIDGFGIGDLGAQYEGEIITGVCGKDEDKIETFNLKDNKFYTRDSTLYGMGLFL